MAAAPVLHWEQASPSGLEDSMPARGDIPEGAPVWVDLAARDLDVAITFYTGLFGWHHVHFAEEYGGYGQFSLNGTPVAGVGPLQDADQPAAWGVYLSTVDADATAVRVRAHGGTVLDGPRDVPDQGRFLMTVDPTGARVAFWQAYGNPGFTTVREPGAPTWFELWTNDHETAVGYYRDVAGWDVHDLPNDQGWRYATHGKGDDAHAGIYDATSELGEHGTPTWVVYFGTDDVDASLVRARALGVTVHEVPKESPHGRLVGVQDPNDTWFQLISV